MTSADDAHVATIPPGAGLASAWTSPGSLGSVAYARAVPAAQGSLLEVDPLGVHPLYWTRLADGTVLASSWLARLVEHPGVDTRYDHETVLLEAMRLPPTGDFATRTRFAAVHRVPGGHRLRLGADGSAHLERTWSVAELPEVDPRITPAEAAELLRERIEAAVRRVLPEHGGVAGHVSGGLDCTAVTCCAQDLLTAAGGGLVAAYSWAPDETVLERAEVDERGLLDQVGERLGIPVRRLVPSPAGTWFDELCADRYPQVTHAFERFVLPDARASGVSVMLSGWGGDELASFNGRAVVRSLVRRGRWLTVWQQQAARRAVTGTDVAAGVAGVRDTASRSVQAVRSFVGTLLGNAPEPVQRLRHPGRHRRARELEAEIDDLIRSAAPAVADLVRTHERRFDEARTHHEFQLALLENGHLQRRTDGWYQTGRLFDIDYRYPLLDLGVVEAAVSLPWTAFVHQGWTRVAFRLAIEPWVPATVAWNISKEEPALFSDRAPAEFRSMGNRLPDDPGYRAMVELAQQASARRPRQRIATRGVRARPDLAPRG